MPDGPYVASVIKPGVAGAEGPYVASVIKPGVAGVTNPVPIGGLAPTCLSTVGVVARIDCSTTGCSTTAGCFFIMGT